jgi:hypothetical protein
MQVFTYWDSSPTADPAQPGLLRLWVRSWAARGWKPRVLTARNAAKHPQFSKLDAREHPRLAMESVKAKWLSPIGSVNFAFTPRVYNKHGIARYALSIDPAAQHAALVIFSSAQEFERCGRSL